MDPRQCTTYVKRMFMRLASLFLSTLPLSAVAETRAVLVGVGDYLYLDADLAGPVNDIGLMADTLILRGLAPGSITILADAEATAPEGARRGAPDRADILAALDASISESDAGDTVVFYFSGHGAQAPDMNGDEGGGMDEIFLPRDAKGWNGAVGLVENAIVDDEFSVFTAQAAAKGVSLIGIIDACHSGTGFRALPGTDARARYISPALLGLTDDDMASGDVQTPGAPPEGDYVFMYAAQSDQRAFEYPLGEERIWHGDFTRALTEVMSEVPDLSYAQLVTAASARMRLTNGQAAQTPDFEGPLANAPVLGGDAPGLSRMQVEGQTLKAGLLRGVTEGSVITLYAGLLDDDIAGQARVTNVRATQADIEYLEPFPTVRVSHAELTERAVDTSVRVGLTDEAASQLAGLSNWADVPLVTEAATHLLSAAQDGGYALTGPDGIVDATGTGTSLRLSGSTAQEVGTQLNAAVARLRLEKALAQMGQGGGSTGFSLASSGPSISFTVEPGRPRGNRCARAQGGPSPATGKTDVNHCDILRVTFDNTTASMQDVTILYIGADHSIDTVWPSQNLSNRVEVAGVQNMTFALQADDERVVEEALIVVAIPAQPGDMRTTFAFAGGGGQASGEVARYLSGVTDPAATRGFSLKPKSASLSVTRLDLTMTPNSLEGD